MPLNLFYITNRPEIALIAEKYGVNRIWVDLETLGKSERQKYMNSVKSKHKVEDISRIKPILTNAEILVRVNPWNPNSQKEIDAVIEAGADIVMLPMWRSYEDVQYFIRAIDGRAKAMLLLETKEAVECIDNVLKTLKVDEIHIGLNDLHISYGLTFMFELLSNGTVEKLCNKFKIVGIPFGFGGIARLGSGILPAEKIIMEHYRLGSTRAILSRSFCDLSRVKDLGEIEDIFCENIEKLRNYEHYVSNAGKIVYEKNRMDVMKCVQQIVSEMKGSQNEQINK